MARLDKEERRIAASYARGQWRSVKNWRAELPRYQAYAREALRKTSRVNIRLSPQDLGAVQRRAVEEGIPYQTLMASVIHKYVSGRFIERRSS